MTRSIRLGYGVAVACMLVATPAAAVDITGTWSLCIASFPFFSCPANTAVSLTSSGGRFTIDASLLSGFHCIVGGAVNGTTGALTVDDTSGCPNFGGMSATATDTSITGTFTIDPICPTGGLQGVRECGACADANTCTIDGCGTTACSPPGSSCTPAFLTGPVCDDGNFCTVGDTCQGGTCSGTPRSCNDNNPCTDDMCTPTGCVFIPNSNPCDDHNVCTVGDTCGGGMCQPGAPRVCGTCETCVAFGAAGCITRPKTGCRHSVTPTKSKLALKDSDNDAGDKVSWTWAAGEATTSADFGDPVASDDYTLCIFDDTSANIPHLFLASTAPAGGSCASGGSCWTGKGTPPGTKGFLYKDSAILLPDGIKTVKLTPGASGRAKVKATGQGTNLALPSPMNVTLPVVVQLRDENGACFESTFTTPQVSREDLFKAKASE
jgi:hypothetical protein